MAKRLAIDALFRLYFGAIAFFHRLALFHNCNFLFASLFQHLNCRKNAGRAGAHNHNIELIQPKLQFSHHLSPII